MKLTTQINGVERALELKPPAEQTQPVTFSLDGVESQADIRQVEPGVYSILLGGRSFEVKIEYGESGYLVAVGGRRYEIAVRDPRKLLPGAAGLDDTGPRQVSAPMPGKVVRILVKPGQQIESGQGLLVVEAMKMQNEIKSPKAGVIKDLRVREGGSVSAGQILLVVE